MSLISFSCFCDCFWSWLMETYDFHPKGDCFSLEKYLRVNVVSHSSQVVNSLLSGVHPIPWIALKPPFGSWHWGQEFGIRINQSPIPVFGSAGHWAEIGSESRGIREHCHQPAPNSDPPTSVLFNIAPPPSVPLRPPLFPSRKKTARL